MHNTSRQIFSSACDLNMYASSIPLLFKAPGAQNICEKEAAGV